MEAQVIDLGIVIPPMGTLSDLEREWERMKRSFFLSLDNGTADCMNGNIHAVCNMYGAERDIFYFANTLRLECSECYLQHSDELKPIELGKIYHYLITHSEI